MTINRFRTGNRGAAVAAAVLLGAGAASPALGQTAYYSLQGSFAADGDKEDFAFSLSRGVSNAETMHFQTFGRSSGTNAAGDNIPANAAAIDSVLELFDSGDASRGFNDDSSISNLDSLVTWTQTFGTALNPNPMPVGAYRLKLTAFDNLDNGQWAVDLVAPADAITFTGRTPTGTSTVSSLKFGTTIPGGNFAVFNSSTTLNVTGEIVVGKTGNATLNHSAGTITAGGNVSVFAADTYNLTGGTLNANNGMSLSGGQFLRTSGTFTLPATKVVGITSGGLFQWGGAASDLFLNQPGSGIDLSGTGSTFRQIDNSGIDSQVVIRGGAFINANVGGTIEAEYLQVDNGSVLVTAAGSSLNVTTGNSAGAFVHVIGAGAGASGTITLSNDVTGSFASTLATSLRMGLSGAMGALNVNTAADLTLQSLDMQETGSSTVTLNGSGSTITQTGASTIEVGSPSGPAHTINVQNSGVFTTGTGAITINKTGTINVAGGTLNANGHVTLDGGKLLHTSGEFDLADNKNLTASNGAQVSFTGAYHLNDGNTFTIQSGSSFSVTDNLDVGDINAGTLTVQDPDTTFTAGATTPLDLALFGGTADVRIRGQATATINALLNVSNSTVSTSSATLRVSSGAEVTAKSIVVGGGSAGTGEVILEGASKITQTGASTLTIGGTGTSTGTVHVHSGTLLTGTGLTTITANGTLINSGGTFTAAAVLNNGDFSSAANTTATGGVTGTGTTNVNAAQTIVTGGVKQGALAIRNNGKLIISQSAPFPAGSNAAVSRVGSLEIENDGAALGSRNYDGTLDLKNNDLIIDYSGLSPRADFEDMIRAGFNGGNFQGTGITSSVAQVNNNFVVAVADNATLATKFGTAQSGPLFSGQDVDLTTVLIKFTHRVDLDLDGLVTPNDASIFGTNYTPGAAARWAIGDMDFDGIFTPNDASIFGTAYNTALASVPEPDVLGVVGLLSVGLSRSRRQ